MTKKERRTASSGTPLREFRKGRDENNLAEFPLALLTDTAPAGVKTIEFEDTLKDWKTGKRITRRVCVTGSDKFGLPTAKDEDVLLALVQLILDTKSRTQSQKPSESLSDKQADDPVQREIDSYLASLTKEALAKLETVAIERAEGVLADGYERSRTTGGQTYAAYRRMLLEREVKRILDDNEMAASK